MQALEKIDHETQVVPPSAIMAISRSELESQLDAAHKYPRQISRFLEEATTLATLNEEVAQSCIYALPRDGKTIAGPSVRLAEICASAYGNMHIAARVVEDTGKEIVARGGAWDIEKNLKYEVETRRRLTGKSGKRFSDDMVTVTGNAAASIALRNAIFKVIPKTYIDEVYKRARAVSVGDAKTLASKREACVVRLQKIGVPVERIFARVGCAKIEDVGLDELEVLIGLGTAIKDKDQSIDEAFPPPDDGAEKAKALEAKLSKKGKPEAPKSQPKVAADADGVIEREPGEEG